MSDPVRAVSIGAGVPAVERKSIPTGPKGIAIQYLGFQNVGEWREYALQAGRGDEASRYTVSIELAAFSRKEALLQDGPDICYQKLLRELSASELPVSAGIAVTADDLANYRAAHSRPEPKKSPAPPTPAPAPWKE